MKPIALKPQDVLVLLKLLVWPERQSWSFAKLASSLGMGASEVHGSVKRAEIAGLYDPLTKRPNRQALFNFLVSGVRYSFPGQLGEEEVRGMPTAYSTPSVSEKLSISPEDSVVWPVRGGKERGRALAPLYPSAPKAAKSDPKLYEMLCLVDAIRIGRTRDRQIVEKLLDEKLHGAN